MGAEYQVVKVAAVIIWSFPPSLTHIHFLAMCFHHHWHHQYTRQFVIRLGIVNMIFRHIVRKCTCLLHKSKDESSLFFSDLGSISSFVSAGGLNIGALADAGSTVAEKSANLVVDLLCGCGCRLESSAAVGRFQIFPCFSLPQVRGP